MTAPTIPPTGRNPASPGQREAARDHVTRLRQDGGTYRSIAAAAALSPATVHALASGRRRAQPGTATAVLTVTSPALPRARLDAGGTRLRLRALHVMGHGSARIARAAGVHPVTIRKLVRGDARTVSPQLRDAIAGRLRRLVGQTRPRPHPLRARRGHRRPQTRHRRELVRRRRPGRRPARHPRLPAPSTAGNPPPAPAPPPTSTRPPATTAEGAAHDRRRPLDLGLHPRVLDVLERHGYRRSDNQHTGQAIGAHPRPGPHLRRHPGPSPRRLRRGAVIPAGRTAAARPARPGRRHRLSRAEVKTLLAALDDRRRRQARPGRDVRRLHRPVLHHLPEAPAAPPRPTTRWPASMLQAARAARPLTTATPRPRPIRGRRRQAARTRPPTRSPANPDRAPGRPRPSSLTHGRVTDMKRDDRPRRLAVPRPLASRPPEYVIVVAASDWVKEHFPAAAANLCRRPAHRPRPPPRPRTRPGSRTMTPTRK